MGHPLGEAVKDGPPTAGWVVKDGAPTDEGVRMGGARGGVEDEATRVAGWQSEGGVGLGRMRWRQFGCNDFGAQEPEQLLFV